VIKYSMSLLAAALALPILTGSVAAQSVSHDKLVAVVVIAKIPPGATRAKVEEGIAAPCRPISTYRVSSARSSQ
jgi:hypothetical protein